MSSAEKSYSLPNFLTSPTVNSLSLEMDYPTFVPDFFKYLTSIDCSSNDLVGFYLLVDFIVFMYFVVVKNIDLFPQFVPQKFCDIQKEYLKAKWILTMKNGHRMYVVYDRVNRKLSGMRKLFNDFGLIGGEILIFQYVDGSNFNVYIIGSDCSEIDYAPFEKVVETSSEFFGTKV